MSITTYAGLLSQLGKMVTFEGDNPGDASIATLETVISLAETRINREARTGYNEAAISGTVTSNAFALPADWRAASMVHFGGLPLEPVSPEYLREHLDGQPSGVCKYYCVQGRSLLFSPTVADSTSVQGYYFKALPALDATTTPTNALFLAANDLYLFACMVEAAPLYGFEDKLQLFEAKYQDVRDTLNTEHQRAAYSSGRIKRRASTRLMG